MIPYVEMYIELDKYIAGNEDLKKSICMLFHLYLRKLELQNEGFYLEELPNLNLFITGSTGTGKTETVTKLAEITNLPFVRIDCTSLSQAGFVGTSIHDYLNDFIKESETGIGIILLDEFDKLGIKNVTSSGEACNDKIQGELLDLFDGRYNHMYQENRGHKNLEAVNNALVIATGSFQNERTRMKNEPEAIGFVKEPRKITAEDWKDKMIGLGIKAELANRFVEFVSTEPLTKEQIRELITVKQDSAYQKFQKLIHDFELNAKDIDILVDKVHKSEQGLRILSTEIYRRVHSKLNIKYEPEIEKAKRGRNV